MASFSVLRIGVIGSGGRGALAAYAHQPEAGSAVVATCDTNGAVLDEDRERYGSGILTTTDYREVLAADVDAVFVTVPDFLHEEYAVEALQAGKAVYLEKPMALTAAGCDRILAVAKEHGQRLYVGHNMRHFPFVLKMKALIDAGAIGEVKAVWCRHFVGNGGDYYFRDWHAEQRYSNGLLLQKGVHDIDVIHWLAGGYTTRVNAFGSLAVYGDVTERLPDTGGPRTIQRPLTRPEVWPPATQRELNARIDVEDTSMMQMRLDNGVLASYEQCHFTPDYWRNYTVIGTEGRMENFGNGEDDAVIRVWNRRRTGWTAEADETIPVKSGEGTHGGADRAIVEEFLRFVREGGTTNTSPLAARNGVAAAAAATASLRADGVAVDVPGVDPELARYFG